MSELSTFRVADQSLRQLLRFFRYDLTMPSDTVRQLVAGILTAFEVEEVYERERMRPKTDGPA